MFGDRKNENSLPLPPIANDNVSATEVLRVWAAPGTPQQLIMQTTWSDPGAWGLLLVDIARHASKAYEADGRDPIEVLKRIHECWNAEWNEPTDDAPTIDADNQK